MGYIGYRSTFKTFFCNLKILIIGFFFPGNQYLCFAMFIENKQSDYSDHFKEEWKDHFKPGMGRMFILIFYNHEMVK